MTDLNGAFDLSLLRNEHDVAAGFNVSNGVYSMEVPHPATGALTGVHMPVLDLNFHMANNKTTNRICVAPDMIMPLIAVLAEWKVKLDQQVASPPVPPVVQP
jgi:hypothetical protein